MDGPLGSMDVGREGGGQRSGMLALKLVGAAAWLLAYREASQAAKEGEQLLPTAAIVANATWEAIYALGGIVKWKELTIEDKFQTLTNLAWLGADSLWIRSLTLSNVDFRRQALQLLPSALTYQSVFLLRYQPGDAARRSAFLQNLAFSAYCALQSKGAESTEHAQRFTIYRAIGTAVPTFTSGILRGYRPGYALPGFGALLFDLQRIARLRGETNRELTLRPEPN